MTKVYFKALWIDFKEMFEPSLNSKYLKGPDYKTTTSNKEVNLSTCKMQILDIQKNKILVQTVPYGDTLGEKQWLSLNEKTKVFKPNSAISYGDTYDSIRLVSTFKKGHKYHAKIEFIDLLEKHRRDVDQTYTGHGVGSSVKLEGETFIITYIGLEKIGVDKIPEDPKKGKITSHTLKIGECLDLDFDPDLSDYRPYDYIRYKLSYFKGELQCIIGTGQTVYDIRETK